MALAEHGCANLRPMVLRQVAARVAWGTAQTALSGVLEAAAIRAALQPAGDGVFDHVAHQPALHDALGALFRELRHEAEPAVVLDAITARGRVGQATVAAFRRYLALTCDYYDVPALAQLAAEAATRSRRWANELGALVLYLPPRLDAAEIALLGRLGEQVPIRAAFAAFGEPQADRLQEEKAAALAAALSVGTITAASVSPLPPVQLTLLSAPDPSEEVRNMVRRLATDVESGVGLWRIAVLYGQEEPYGLLVREALDAAELPWQGAVGRPVATGWAARSLLALLSLHERRFAREAVLDWLAGRPPRDGVDAPDPLGALPLSAWDRCSRQAQVLEGPRQWIERLERLAAGLERGSARLAPEGAARQTAEAGVARAIAQAITRLETDTRPPRDGAAWEQFVAWAQELRARYLPHDDQWPVWEAAASRELDAALASLQTAAELEPTTTLHVFRSALAAAVAARRLPQGRPGAGIVVGPVGAVLGAPFDRVYVLGLAEGLYPSRPPMDPLAATDDARDPLGRRERQREGERRALLGALAAADGGHATVSYPRSDGAARAMYPSRWFLELAGECAGRPVYGSDLPKLFLESPPWLVRIASTQDGVARLSTPADLADRRLASVVAWHRSGRDLAQHPLAQRAELPLGRALAAARARRSHAFTPYDGNLRELAGVSRSLTRPIDGGATSATAVERWATCPFQYLLVNVLRVEATQRPQDEWTINPLQRGILIHEILDRFFRELQAAGRLGPDDHFTAADHARLDALAREAFAELEATGRTGHPLAWENVRTTILADLHTLLEKDEEWRRAEQLQPARFEQPFGFEHDPISWPPATVPLADGRTISFRGAIDRVDFSPPGVVPRRALVIDYKSGGAYGYADLRQDPLLGGRHVQLALYGRALRLGLGAAADDLEVRAEYRFVSAKGEFVRLGVTVDAALEERLGQVVEVAADGVSNGIFLAEPGPRDRNSFQNCRYCDYDRVCATTRDELWERKHAEAGR
jgi:hypothetical protein